MNLVIYERVPRQDGCGLQRAEVLEYFYESRVATSSKMMDSLRTEVVVLPYEVKPVKASCGGAYEEAVLKQLFCNDELRRGHRVCTELDVAWRVRNSWRQS